MGVSLTSSGEVNMNSHASIKGIRTQGCGITFSTVSVLEVTLELRFSLVFSKLTNNPKYNKHFYDPISISFGIFYFLFYNLNTSNLKMAKSLLIVSALFLAVVASINAAPTPKKRK